MLRGLGISIITIVIIILIISLIVNFYIFSDRNNIYFNKRNWGKIVKEDTDTDTGDECTAEKL